jgi:hypothetical protein
MSPDVTGNKSNGPASFQAGLRDIFVQLGQSNTTGRQARATEGPVSDRDPVVYVLDNAASEAMAPSRGSGRRGLRRGKVRTTAYVGLDGRRFPLSGTNRSSSAAIGAN